MRSSLRKNWEVARRVAAEVKREYAAIFRPQSLGIAKCLRAHELPPGRLLARNRVIRRRIVKELHEVPYVWSAFVELTGAVKESRPVAQRHRHVLCVSDRGLERGEVGVQFWRFVQVSLDGNIVTRRDVG